MPPLDKGNLLREGGKARTSDISRLAKLRYPDSPLYQQAYASADLGIHTS